MSPDGSTVFVTGESPSAELWVARYALPNYDAAFALGVSPDGSTVVVTGESLDHAMVPDYATVAYDAATGADQWVSRYDGPGL